VKLVRECADCGHRKSAHGPYGCRKCANNPQRKQCMKFKPKES
jgi:aromatic ring-opening dioxygenase LigB subunit